MSAPPLRPPGSHSLKHFLFAESWPGHRKSRFVVGGYVDDTLFVRFDSDPANPRMEPRVPWVAQEEPGYWDLNTRNRGRGTEFPTEPGLLRGYYNRSEGGEPHGPRGLGAGTPTSPGTGVALSGRVQASL